MTEDWYFVSHRLPLAIAARDRGWRVIVATRVGEAGARLAAAGVEVVPLSWKRGGWGVTGEVRTVLELMRLYRREHPDIVHHVALKSILFGSLAARIAGAVGVVNAVAGLGIAFSAQGRRAALLRGLLVRLFRWTLFGLRQRVVFQNSVDRDVFVRHQIVRGDETVLIRGAGVDLKQFAPGVRPTGVPTVGLASRMLWPKGVGTFVAAARILRERGVRARFVLVGRVDHGSRAAVPEVQLVKWAEEGIVEWWGARQDMPQVLRGFDVVCLPSSYGEGVPKVLLEAAACGCPIVASDLPGCCEVVQEGVNGYTTPPGDPVVLAERILRLLQDPDLRDRMGQAGRRMAESRFGVQQVVEATLDLYEDLADSSTMPEEVSDVA